ncbi:ATP-dependent DNA helicase [Geomicrobium sediminis]|uniref:Exodeoxyribonuclease-5 n=1 Tax=Geomicrobium sediminis TaxID=1347788 RepID=A0ABS2PHA8_9BACL|nr:AAA family ATPase [Geomicrobium sediminis]MBM7634198.1 exodeoxyribonuclease-5 [Geomicrobium sediminis]
MTITLTQEQKDAIQSAKRWFEDCQKGRPPYPFVIAGYAGTGKTTVVNAMIEELGIPMNKVLFGTFTGKAALKLREKELPAFTLHRLLYEVASDENGRPLLKKREPSTLKYYGYELLVIDEVGTVNKELLIDALYYGIPIIALGDDEQLEAVGENHTLLKTPDVFLVDQHRQAKECPINQLALKVRSGDKIGYGRLGHNVFVLPKDHKRVLDGSIYSNADQVIVRSNKLRKQINAKVREYRRYLSKDPAINDKVICNQNNWSVTLPGTSLSLINGLSGYVRTIKNKNGLSTFDFEPDFTPGKLFKNVSTATQDFYEAKKQHTKNALNEFRYGYAITDMKAQGSEWSNVCFHYSSIGMCKTKNRKSLYSGITRTTKQLILVF